MTRRKGCHPDLIRCALDYVAKGARSRDGRIKAALDPQRRRTELAAIFADSAAAAKEALEKEFYGSAHKLFDLARKALMDLHAIEAPEVETARLDEFEQRMDRFEELTTQVTSGAQRSSNAPSIPYRPREAPH